MSMVQFPREALTRALPRIFDLPGADAFALITLDDGRDDAGANVLGPAGLRHLGAALAEIERAAEAGEIVGVGVTGKPFAFAAGADPTDLASITDRSAGRELAGLGTRTFRRLATLAVPSFAFVNGAALGGGLELALHCTYRSVSATAGPLGLPECFLGLVPGWGGAALLPRLIGAEGAVTVVVGNALAGNRTLSGPAALEAGIVDAMFAPADFLEESLRWAARVLAGDAPVERAEVDTGDAWAAAVARGRALIEGRVQRAAPAPARALDIISLARAAPLEECFAAGADAFADLLVSDELRAGLYAAELTGRRARKPLGAPAAGLAREVRSVGVVGAGLTGRQLAWLLARRLDVPVALSDPDDAVLARAMAWLDEKAAGLGAGDAAAADRARRIRTRVFAAPGLAGAGCDLVIEALPDDLPGKRAALAALEDVVPAGCVLATTTSACSVSALAADLTHPERVVGLHLGNPVGLVPLLEIVRGERTDEATLATSFVLARRLGKAAVAVSDQPGFVVNRLLVRMLAEVLDAVAAGTPPAVADRALDELGLPTSPFTLLALLDPAVVLRVSASLEAAFGERFAVPAGLRRLVAAAPAALFRADARGGRTLDPAVADLLAGPAGTGSDSAGEVRTVDEIHTACLAALAEEIALMLDAGVVAEAADVDLCMLLGAGWPRHLGGITPYLDRTGISEKVNGKRFLPPGVADLPAPPPAPPTAAT